MQRQKNQTGFTILELMIATLIFSIVLLVVTAGILRFSQDYYKGVNATNTQTTTRAIMSDIVQGIQFGRGTPVHLGTVGSPEGWCIDTSTFYTFVIGRPLGTSQAGLVKTTGSNCTAATPTVPGSVPNSSTQRDLLSGQMRVAQLDITPPATGTAYTVTLRVAFGTPDLFVDGAGNQPTGASWKTAHCKNQAGQQFCAVSELTTTVQPRL